MDKLVTSLLATATICLGIVSAHLATEYIDNAPLRKYQQAEHLDNMPDYSISANTERKKELAAIVRLEDKDGQFFCSGAVISDDYVLTAAHCLVQGESRSMRKTKLNVVSMPGKDGVVVVVEAEAAAVNKRADYALVKGDFKRFTRLHVRTNPRQDIMVTGVQGGAVTCGFPWGAEGVCYATGQTARRSFEGIVTEGNMYPGMSGGPVLEIATEDIIAVNSGIGDGYIMVMPLIGLFETLSVRVVQ